jgi:low affinity Fe/Cu permease
MAVTGILGRQLTRLGVMLSHPSAFAAAAAYAAGWVIADPQTFDWHAGATIAALFMTLFIQRATHRDTQALHAKIDELLHVNRNARDALAHVDEEEPEDIEKRRKNENDILKDQR